MEDTAATTPEGTMTATTTTGRKTFDTSQYVLAHGRNPRGTGTWAFATRAAVKAAAGELPEGIVWSNYCTFTQAKAQVPAGDWVVLS